MVHKKMSAYNRWDNGRVYTIQCDSDTIKKSHINKCIVYHKYQYITTKYLHNEIIICNIIMQK